MRNINTILLDNSSSLNLEVKYNSSVTLKWLKWTFRSGHFHFNCMFHDIVTLSHIHWEGAARSQGTKDSLLLCFTKEKSTSNPPTTLTNKNFIFDRTHIKLNHNLGSPGFKVQPSVIILFYIIPFIQYSNELASVDQNSNIHRDKRISEICIKFQNSPGHYDRI